MSVLEVLQTCQRSGIRLAAKDDRLLVSVGADSLTAELRQELTLHKAEILAWLNREESARHLTIEKHAGRREYPLSFSQQRLWFIDRLEQGSAQYNVPCAFKWSGELNRAALQQALAGIVERHEVLRTRYEQRESEAVQVVEMARAVAVSWIDLSQCARAQREERVRRLAEAEVERSFDLSAQPMVRCTVIELASDEHVVLFTLHHIACDGWSLGLLVKEFVHRYTAQVSGEEVGLAELSIQYGDYALWQRRAQASGSLQADLRYWREALQGIPLVHRLPLDRARPARQSFGAQRHLQIVDLEVLEGLRGLAQSQHGTLFMVLQAAFAALLWRWSAETDIVMAVPIAGREQAEVAPLIGFFVNTLVFRTDLSGDPRVVELLSQARGRALEAYAHQQLPFDLLIDALGPERSLAYNPVCQIKFALQNHEMERLKIPGVQLESVGKGAERVHFDLDLTASEAERGLQLSWSFKKELFEQQSIERLSRTYVQLLTQMVSRPQARLSELEWVDEADGQLLQQWSQGAVSAAYRESILVRQFEQQSQRTPQAIAVRCGEQWLSYEELDHKANRLAHALLEQGVCVGSRVGVNLERSVELLIALLGVMKSGAAYVPLDDAQGVHRLRQIVSDARLSVVLRDRRSAAAQVALGAVDELYMDEACEAQWLREYAWRTPEVEIEVEDSVYVLYTSGTTGRPKGVEVTHAGLTDYCAFAREGYYAQHLSGSVVATAPGFDLTVPGLYVPLLTGGCVQLMGPQQELRELAQWLEGEESAAVLLRLTPTHVQGLLLLVDEAVRQQRHVWVIGGEVFGVELARQLERKYPRSVIYNHYGPTETVVGCAWCEVTPARLEQERLPIGRAMSNTQLYVLNEHRERVPIGVAGEMYIGGAGVAKGYLGQAQLTAEKFIASPFAAGGRLYRSGDRVRYRNDGQLEFLGRVDQQVKLRGYRIELAEIESCLQGCPGVREAAVVVRGEGSEAQLLGYLVGEVSTAQLRGYVRGRLPGYMEPAAYAVLEQLPRTVNGKVDKAALPLVKSEAAHYVAPQGELEEQLAQIWQRVLKCERVGAQDNFFQLGGHSLLAMRVVSEIARQLGHAVPVRTLFEHSTLRALAQYLQGCRAPGYEGIEPVARSGLQPLSFAQQRLWFIDRLEGGSVQYNMPTALRLQGELDEVSLQGALDALVRRHEVLRTVYEEVQGTPLQKVLSAQGVRLEREDLSGSCEEARGARLSELAQREALRPFDLSQDLMLRALLIRLGSAEHALLITLHHIACDGWSIGVLVKEFVTLYSAAVLGHTASLAALPIQYVDYAAWQHRRLQGENLARGLAYWREQLAGLPPVHSLPLDYPRPAHQQFAGLPHIQILDADQVKAIYAFCQARQVTLFVFIQTVFAVLLGHHSRETDIVVGTPTAGRTHPDLEPLIGFFINTLVLRTDLEGNPSFCELLKCNQKMVLDAHTHQDIPFEMLVDELKPARSLSYNPLTQILINCFESAPQELPSLPGLAIEPLRKHASEDLSKADLTLYARNLGERLFLKWSYRSSLFEQASIVRLAEGFATLLKQIIQSPERRIQDYTLLAAAEQELLLAQALPVVRDYEELWAHERIARSAAQRPHAVALSHRGAEITYLELDSRACSLAAHLMELGVGPGSVVGVLAERGVHLAVAVLATLKAGAAYLPLAIELPEATLTYMLADSAVRVVLAQRQLAGRISAVEQVVFLEDPAIAPVPHASEPAWPRVQAQDASHVLYTSGSTGNPKGVISTHGSLNNRIAWMHEAFPFEADDVSCLITSTAFVRSVWELLVPLTAGQKVVVIDAEVIRDLRTFAAQLEQQRVTRIVTAPSLARALIELPDVAQCWSRLRYWFVSGEPLNRQVAELLRRALPHTTLCNLYGSTETMSDVSCQVVDRIPERPVIPIGKPIANTGLLILDSQLRPVPMGVLGEICVMGRNLARGYNNEELPGQERFVRHSLGSALGERLYRTGDLGRLLDGGVIECLGRADHQIKLRGFRIELGEIEARLRQCDGVKDAVVLVKGQAEAARLVAYVVPEPAVAVDWQQTLRAQLRLRLPHYMQPATYMVLPGLPLTPNGKINRRALPEPDCEAPGDFSAPASDTEATIAAVWCGLLKLDRVSATANFFELGGHSLLATRAVSDIAAQLHKLVPVRAMFEHTTLRALARFIDEQAEVAIEPIPRLGSQQSLPLSFAQERLWFVDRFEGGSVQYNLPMTIRLSGSLDITALQGALDAIVARHEVLRTTYASEGGKAVQRVQPPQAVPLVHIDMRRQPLDERERQVQRLSSSAARKPFDLSADLMLRCSLLTLTEQESVILFTLHHIASDGWSKGVLVKEFVALYSALMQGRPDPLPPLPVQYADYAHWQRSVAQREILLRDRSYWQAQLQGLPQVHSLPVDKPRPRKQEFAAGRVVRHIDRSCLDRLRALAQRNEATLFMVLQSAFALLLGRWSNETDIVIGTPVAGRTRKEIEPLIGLFVNTLLLRTDLSGDPAFLELLARNRQMALDAYAHQTTSFETLVETLKPERHLSHAPLCQVVMALQNHERGTLSLPGLQISLTGNENTGIDLDLHLAIAESASGLQMRWLYAQSLFESSTIERLAQSYERLLAAIVSDASQPVQRLALLPVQDREELRHRSAVQVQPLGWTCVQELFEAQVERAPEAVAAVFEEQSLSYAELNARANRVARYLRAQGVGPDTVVGLCVERSLQMVIGVLGILKAGGAYLPMDPMYPPERLAQMLADAGVEQVLSQSAVLQSVSLLSEKSVLPLDDVLGEAVLSQYGTENLARAELGLSASHLAYVIYTSGSSGEPKGVMLTHAGLVNLAQNQQELLELDVHSRVLGFASMSFDGSVFEWLMALGSGASLYICGEPQRHSGQSVSQFLRVHGITHAAIPPALLPQVPLREDYALRVLILGGEACEEELAWRWAQHCRVCNSYGPSEATVAATHAEIEPGQPMVLGRALRNVELRVLNERCEPQPIAVVGELYLGGVGLARGYLNRAELTAQRFIEHPWQPGERLYRTGDLVRWLPTGELQFVGRADEQVKIRGFRIELGEIQGRLLEHEAVREAMVVVRQEGTGPRLVAYVVCAPSAGEPVNEVLLSKAWRTHLRQRLPEYMIPAAFVVLEQLPLNRNGKVDRARLPAPDYQSQQPYMAPQSELEQRLAQIWQQVLKVEQVGTHDNFFEIGGHSLLATQVISHVAEQLERQIPIRALFEHSSIRELAVYIETLGISAYGRIPRVARGQDLPLSFSQQRLWFIDQLEGGSTQYNMHAHFQLVGELDLTAVQRALDRIVARHEVLRTCFATRAGVGVQIVQPAGGVPIRHLDLSQVSEPEQTRLVMELARQDAFARFDLSADLMLRCTLVRLREHAHALLLATHHIASDGWSMSVLAKEFMDLYEAQRHGRSDPLPELPIQYADFAHWQRTMMQGEALEQQLAYWRANLAGAPQVHGLMLDKVRPPRQSFQGAYVLRHLDHARRLRLHGLARMHDATLFMVLHGALAILIGRWSNETDVVIGTPVVGRMHKELEPLIGFFINSLVLRTDLSGEPSFAQVVQRVRRVALDAYANQAVPFEMLVEDLRPERTLSHSPLYQISFTFHNNERAAFSLSDLEISSLRVDSSLARYDLELHVAESDTGLHIRWVYATSLFTVATIERLADSFAALIDAALAAPDVPVDSLPLVSESERERLLAWNDNSRSIAVDRCAHELFEAQAARAPEATAVVFEDRHMTYRELNAEANRVAHYLRERGVGPETLVGLCVERSLESVIGLLGILKAGGAYVPLDPEYPAERLAFMLEDAGVELVLTHNAVLSEMRELSARTVLPLDAALRTALLAGYAETNLAKDTLGLTPAHLAYVVYTSGSTGQPKGVMLEHRGLINLAQTQQRHFAIDADSRVLQFSSLSFDAATWDWLLALAHGASLHVCSQDVRLSPEQLSRYLLEHRITHALIPPAMLAHLDAKQSYYFRVLVVGGEACEEELAWRWARNCRLVNAYGPSENTVVATWGDVQPEQSVTLGHAVDNCSLFVMNAARCLAPTGVPGELYVGGLSLARGYWNRPELTRERFVPHPLASADERLYRTGDRVRWLPNGELQFLGRMDDQVKVRGFRIELGEIEAALLALDRVKQAVTLVQAGRDADKRIIAYVVPKHDGEAAAHAGNLAAALRAELERKLPGYMVPAAFVVLSRLPVTPNGKIDRQALPRPAAQVDSAYAAPTTEIEHALVTQWAELLELNPAALSVDANFFDLGGHSILAIKLVTLMSERFALRLNVSDVFRYASLRELASYIQDAAGKQVGWNALVILEADQVVPSVYCVPAAGLMAASYQTLARALKGHLALKIFEPCGFDGRAEPCRSMGEIVHLNLQALLEHDPAGPYLLAGHSFGGAVAFEMARLLQAQGREVRLLLLDSILYLRDSERRQHSTAGYLRGLLAAEGITVPDNDDPRRSDDAHFRGFLKHRTRQHGHARAPLDAEVLENFVRVFEAQLAIYRDYVPSGVFAGPVSVVLAADGAIARMDAAERTQHYCAYCAQTPQSSTVTGNHLSILTQDHAGTLAKSLQASVLAARVEE